MIENLEFQGKVWRVLNKIQGNVVKDPNSLKDTYGADMVIKNSQDVYFILDEIIDAEFEEI